MSLIYTPKGKAREYSPLALNVYSGGCDHGCKYCYCSGIMRGAWGTTPKPRSLNGLARESCAANQQILLSFIADPYCAADVKHGLTRNALKVLSSSKCSVAILTKGGTRCLRDIDVFSSWPDGRIKVGATLTFSDPVKSSDWEPGAATPENRIEALRRLHSAGVKTWASIEPVIDPEESLSVIKSSLPYVDAYKVGRWNHDQRSSAINWLEFGKAAVEIIRSAGKMVYVKDDLRRYFQDGYLTAEECDMNSLSLPDKPREESLFA